jgi:hypothetical protein
VEGGLMPQGAFVWVTTAVATALSTAGAAAGVTTVLSTLAGAVAVVGATIGITYALGTLTTALMGRPKGLGGANFREMTVKAPTAARGIIYGEITTGGVLVFEHTTGANNQFLDYVIVLAGHQCEDITDVWLDDVKVLDSEINGGSSAGGAVTTGDLGPRDGDTICYIYKFLGTSAQTASTVLTATDGNGYGGSETWTTAHRLRGCTYVHIRLRRSKYFENHGAPSNFKFRVKGAKVYDPRLDTTNGGSGSHRLADATTWAWSNNPALCVADFIAGGTIANDVATPVRKRGFAVATPSTDIDWPAVIAAANICDEDVNIPPSGTQNRYECDVLLVPSDDMPDADCLDQILTSMIGQVVYTKGKYTTYAGAYQSPAYTLTEADLAGEITYVTGKGRSERYNYVRGTRYDLDLGQETEFLSRTDTSYVTADGATLYHDIELPATANEYRAQRIAQIILRRSREQQTLIWPGQLSAAKINIWETVQVTVSELGISAKVFRCIGRKRRSGANGEPLVELTLREEVSTTYSDPLVADYGTISVATDPGPISGVLDEPTSLVAMSHQNGIEFVITPAAGASTDEIYDLYEYTAEAPFGSASVIWSANATRFFLPKTDTTQRYYWVIARRNEFESVPIPATGGGVPGKAGSASSGLGAYVDESNLSASGTGTTVTTATVTVTPYGGTAPYGYSWSKVSGDTMTLSAATSASTTFSGTSMAAGSTLTAVYRCEVQDNVAATTTVDISVTVTRAATGGMTVSISPSELDTGSAVTPMTSATATATPSGGTGPYTYSWTRISGDTFTINSSTAAATTMTASVAPGHIKAGTYRCTVTDSTAGTPLVAYDEIPVTFENTV